MVLAAIAVGAILITLGALALRASNKWNWVVGLVVVVVFAFLPVAAKAFNARVVITPDYVESRDALRRSTRCDRSKLASWVLVRGSNLSRVLLVGRDGGEQLRLAWDSYSDEQIHQIVNALGLSDETR